MNYTSKNLKEMQTWTPNRKLQVTQTRILEWYSRFDGQVYVSFSGGKDSTVLLHIVRQLFPNVKAVFSDTGLEYPEIREFVKTFDNIEIVKPKLNFKEVLIKYGYPVISKEQAQFIYEAKNTKSEKLLNIRLNGNKWNRGKISEKWKPILEADFNISHKCCDVMKKSPLKSFEMKTNLKPIIGTLAEESANRKTSWLRYGCNSFKESRPESQPLSFWTEQDILNYLYEKEIPCAPVYGDIEKDKNDLLSTTGCSRTGCIFCGFGCHMEKEPNRFQMLKETHPKLYDYCIGGEIT